MMNNDALSPVADREDYDCVLIASFSVLESTRIDCAVENDLLEDGRNLIAEAKLLLDQSGLMLRQAFDAHGTLGEQLIHGELACTWGAQGDQPATEIVLTICEMLQPGRWETGINEMKAALLKRFAVLADAANGEAA